MTNEASERFKAIVLRWMVSQGFPAVSVESVTAEGSSWNGDTEGGFYDGFDTDIVWLDADGKKHHEDLDGDQMPLLWNFVMKEA